MSCAMPKMITFFQDSRNFTKYVNYFSGLAECWQALSNLKLILKSHANTRWTSKQTSTHFLYAQDPLYILYIDKTLLQVTKELHFIVEETGDR